MKLEDHRRGGVNGLDSGTDKKFGLGLDEEEIQDLLEEVTKEPSPNEVVIKEEPEPMSELETEKERARAVLEEL